MEDLLDEATSQRLRRAKAGEDVARYLRIASLQPGDAGVLRAEVVHVQSPRTFNRRNGTQGLVGRVSLTDGTGEADLVLWDEENRLVRDDTLAPGRHIVIRGVQVKAGYRSGIELALGSATVEAMQKESAGTLTGTLVDIPATELVEGRFQCQMTLRTAEGEVLIIAWDEAVKALRQAGVGATVELRATPHPLLEGVYFVDSGGVAQTTMDEANNQPPSTSDT